MLPASPPAQVSQERKRRQDFSIGGEGPSADSVVSFHAEVDGDHLLSASIATRRPVGCMHIIATSNGLIQEAMLRYGYAPIVFLLLSSHEGLFTPSLKPDFLENFMRYPVPRNNPNNGNIGVSQSFGFPIRMGSTNCEAIARLRSPASEKTLGIKSIPLPYIGPLVGDTRPTATATPVPSLAASITVIERVFRTPSSSGVR